MRGSVVSCCGVKLYPEGSGKGDYSVLSKVCYPWCKKAIVSLRERLTFVRKLQAQDVTTPHDPLLVRNFYVQATRCGSCVSGFVGPARHVGLP